MKLKNLIILILIVLLLIAGFATLKNAVESIESIMDSKMEVLGGEF